MEKRSRARIVVAAAAMVNTIAAMAAWSCLPDISPAKVAPLDAGDTGTAPVPQAMCGDGVIDLDAGEQCDPGDAAAIGCNSACTVDCPTEAGALFDPSTHHCYFVGLPSPEQDTADEGCKAVGGHLVTFTSLNELQTVTAWDGVATTGGVWVGLSLSNSARAFTSVAPLEPGYPDPALGARCDGCYAQAQAQPTLPPYKDAFPPIPLADGGKLRGACVVASKDTSQPWYQLPCDTVIALARTVCEREPAGTSFHSCVGQVDCLSVPSTLGKKRYIYSGNSVTATADDARAFCASENGQLFSPDTAEERDQIAHDLASETSSTTPLSFWIGLSNGIGGAWKWDDEPDGGPASTRPSIWGDNEPTATNAPSRAVMRLSLGDYDTQLAHVMPSTQSFPYLCEVPTH